MPLYFLHWERIRRPYIRVFFPIRDIIIIKKIEHLSIYVVYVHVNQPHRDDGNMIIVSVMISFSFGRN